jgi:hypothetical protein
MNKLCAEVRHGGLNTIPHRAWGQGRGAGEGGRGDRYRNRFGLVEKKKNRGCGNQRKREAVRMGQTRSKKSAHRLRPTTEAADL